MSHRKILRFPFMFYVFDMLADVLLIGLLRFLLCLYTFL